MYFKHCLINKTDPALSKKIFYLRFFRDDFMRNNRNVMQAKLEVNKK